eukprot:COSAG02_NODE_2275_length_9246_cov_50.124194_4_plen_240_part_00
MSATERAVRSAAGMPASETEQTDNPLASSDAYPRGRLGVVSDPQGREEIKDEWNSPMLALQADQIYSRLEGRWSAQAVQCTLNSAIALTIAFGSEFMSLDQFSIVARRAYLCVSAASFLLNFNASCIFVKLITDLGRTPNHRMHELVRYHDLNSSDIVYGPGYMILLVQVGMAFFGLDIYAGAAYCVTLVATMVLMTKAGNAIEMPNHFQYSAPPATQSHADLSKEDVVQLLRQLLRES